VNIHEYQAKEILSQYGLPIPKGQVASDPESARRIAAALGGPVVVKAQVLVGGRGKAGGVKLAKDPDEAAARAKEPATREPVQRLPNWIVQLLRR
jgi:succinyl-CoA synthetase beta subunit